jgi:hypothetical protein
LGDANGFFADFERLFPAGQLERILAAHAPLSRRPPRISAAELLAGLVYHVSQGQGALAAHLHELTGKKISDSAASQRRLTMPWDVFEAILDEALAPLADPALQPQAFYAGLRLVGIDGTQFSLSNTPRILGTMTKAASRRFEAAFAKLGCAVLIELGTHAPLAAAISAPDLAESEAVLASQLFARLPAESLLLGDRLYGNGAFIARLLAGANAGAVQAFLLRVSQTPRPKLFQRLADGSAVVEVRLGAEEARLFGQRTLAVREVRGRVRRPGKRWSEVRLWTNLLDEKAHPALELLALYARRWEQELAYHELKVELRGGSEAPLASHTPETAAQEIAALLIAMTMVARARLQAAEQAGAAPLRVSFGRTLASLRPLWSFLSLGADLLSLGQRRAFIARVLERLASQLLPPKRRARSCPRAVRQPIKSWPRLTKAQSHKGEWQHEIDTIEI